MAEPDAGSATATRRREWVLIALTAVVFIAFLVVQLVGPAVGGSSQTSNVTFFLLTNLNVILLVLLAFLVGRNLIRLTVDRRRGLFGSRLRTRLVILFVGMSLAPTLVMFVVARVFLNDAIETWFDTRVGNAIAGAAGIADGHYQFAADNAVHFATTAAARLGAADLLRPGADAALAAAADGLRRDLNLAHLRVFGADGAVLHASAEKPLLERMPAGPHALHERILAGETLAATLPLGRADVIRAGAPVVAADGSIVGGVTVDYLVPRSLARTARSIARAYGEYVQVSRLEQPLKNQYVLMLALVAMVVVFSATWVGIRQSRSLTVPLLRLAEGTREVAQGNWRYRIPPATDAETGVLVDSFNRMTADLQAINEQLEERRKFVESILANVTVGVVALDEGGRITTTNRAAEAMLGLPAAAAAGRPSEAVFAARELGEVAQLVAEQRSRPERPASRQILLAAGEQPITALVSAMSLLDDAGVPRGVLLFFENVTDLLRVQRMEAWREVARRLAHEIKNPLTPIQLSAQRLRRRYLERLGPAERGLLDECTATIVAQVEALKHLVTEFSSFARLPAVELRPGDLAEVVDETLALFRQGHPALHFRFAPPAGIPPVAFDRAAVSRALLNMLDNAVAACEAAPDRVGEIAIAITHDAAREVVALEIADNGTGMTPEVKHRVFEPYFSTKRDGTGLGMAIVAAIVADHRAYIRVAANQPHGTRFTIDFPVRGDGAAAAV